MNTGLVVVFVFSIISSFFHPYHVSVTEVTYNKKEKIFEITSRIFTDDFENTLTQNYHTRLDLTNPTTNKPLIDKYISEYLNKNFSIFLNGKPAKANYIGYEIVEDAAWVYIEVPVKNEIKSVRIKNTLLFDYKKEQINLVHVTVGDKRQSDQIKISESSVEFKF